MQNPMSAQSNPSNPEKKPVIRRRGGGQAKDLREERTRFDRQRRLAERRMDDDFDSDDEFEDLDKDFDVDLLDDFEDLDESEDLDDDEDLDDIDFEFDEDDDR